MQHARLIKTSFLALGFILAGGAPVHADGHLVGGVKLGAAFSQFTAQPTLILTGSPYPNFIGNLNKKPSEFVGEFFLGYHKSYDGFYLWNDFSIATPNPEINEKPFFLPSTDIADPGHIRFSGFSIKPGFTLGAGVGFGFDISENMTLQTGLKFLLTSFKATANLDDAENPNKSRYGFGVAPTLQMGYKVTPKITATLSYAYHVYQSLQTTILGDNATATIRSSNYAPRYHHVMAGLTYTFGKK